MDFHFCKSRFWIALVMATIIACLCFLFAGCYEEDGNVAFSSALVENKMTRQDFYSLLYKEITQDELLRSIYFPKSISYDPMAVLFESSGEREFSEESHEALVYKTKAKNIANLKITSKVYQQGGESEQIHWLWHTRAHKTDDYAPWSSLIADFGSIKDENKAAVALLCEVGLAQLTVNQEDYSIHLYPDEAINQSEANILREKIKMRQRFEPSNAILTHDHKGNEIFLCFSDSISLCIFKNIFTHLLNDNEMLNSFVYFDEKGTELSLWVNSVSGGMFSIPLNIAQGVVCVLPYYANTALLEQRFGIITAMLPPPTQSKAANDFVQVICKNTNKADFLYTVSKKTNFKISVSISPSESNSVIYIKVI